MRLNKHSTGFIILLILVFSFASPSIFSQNIVAFADSIRMSYKIPELAFAVISSDSTYIIDALGVKRADAFLPAQLNDKFRIGSNTKCVTALIAARLVKDGSLTWDTRFFDVYPELRVKSNSAYHNLSLINLLSFRTNLINYTYTNNLPAREKISGTLQKQRYEFAKWFFQQEPAAYKEEVNFGNLGYVAAGLMIEKVAGKSYEELVVELGNLLSVNFSFGNPNYLESLQTWGHSKDAVPEAPNDNYKLNWLGPAGNISTTLPDYCKFVQQNLKGLKGQSDLLSQEEFNFLHFGLKKFSIGWFWDTDESYNRYSFHYGNPGTFLSMVYLYPEKDKAFLIFSNIQSEAAASGMNLILEKLKMKYLN